MWSEGQRNASKKIRREGTSDKQTNKQTDRQTLRLLEAELVKIDCMMLGLVQNSLLHCFITCTKGDKKAQKVPIECKQAKKVQKGEIYIIGAPIHICQELHCLPYAGFFLQRLRWKQKPITVHTLRILERNFFILSPFSLNRPTWPIQS